MEVHVEHALGDPFVVGSVVIEGDLVGDPEADEEGDGHAGGEAEDVDGGGAFASAEVAPGEGEIVF